MGSYATRAQFYAMGLPPAACVPESRSLSSVIVASSAFELPGHGFSGGEVVRFVALGDGAELPGQLNSAELYEVDVIGADLFKVKLGGSAVVITTAGSGVIAAVEDITAKIDEILEATSSYLDAHAKAYRPPFAAPYPKWATRTVCKLAALDVALVLRRSNPSFNLDDIKGEAEKAEAFLSRLDQGRPTADQPTDQTPAKAEAGAVGWKKKPSQDWGNSDNGGAL